MKNVFLEHIELWLSALGLVIIGVVPYLVAPPGAAWKIAALTAIAVGLLHGVLFWAVRRRREEIRDKARARLEAQNEKLEEHVRERTTALAEKTDQLRRLAQCIQSAREAERTRIAREVHDVLGQALTGLQFDVTWMVRRAQEESLQGKLWDMSTIISAMTRTVQEIATELRPGLLDEVGIVAALEWQTRQFEERTGIHSTFFTERHELALGRDRSTALFRIFQEALSNAARHAEASQVKVLLQEEEDHLVLKVEDDGRGIRGDEVNGPGSLGILGMRERAAEWDGAVRLDRLPPGGTRLTVRLPTGESSSTTQEDAYDQGATGRRPPDRLEGTAGGHRRGDGHRGDWRGPNRKGSPPPGAGGSAGRGGPGSDHARDERDGGASAAA